MTGPATDRAWELALGLLFEVDVAGTPLKDAVEASEELRQEDADLQEAATQLVIRAAGNRNRVEALLRAGVKHYELARLPHVDRSILRLAAAELLLDAEPAKAVIDRAARLARKYGGADSDRFVVGVLKGLGRPGQASKSSAGARPSTDPSPPTDP